VLGCTILRSVGPGCSPIVPGQLYHDFFVNLLAWAYVAGSSATIRGEADEVFLGTRMTCKTERRSGAATRARIWGVFGLELAAVRAVRPDSLASADACGRSPGLPIAAWTYVMDTDRFDLADPIRPAPEAGGLTRGPAAGSAPAATPPFAGRSRPISPERKRSPERDSEPTGVPSSSPPHLGLCRRPRRLAAGPRLHR